MGRNELLREGVRYVELIFLPADEAVQPSAAFVDGRNVPD
jgi:hypothetical protein